MVMAEFNTIVSYVVVFFGQVFLNLNWAVVSDIVLVSIQCFSKMKEKEKRRERKVGEVERESVKGVSLVA